MAERARRTSSAVRRHARRDAKGQRGRLQPVSNEYFKELQVIMLDQLFYLTEIKWLHAIMNYNNYYVAAIAPEQNN